MVTVPVLFRLAVNTVMPLAVVLLLFNTTLPAPVTPPDTVSSAVLLLVRVRLPAPTVTAPLTVNAEVALLSVIPVTLLPTAALITLAAVIPELVIVPVLLTAVVDSVITPAPPELSVRLPVPVTPPLKVRALATGDRTRLCVFSVTAPLKVLAALSVIVATPVLPEATEIALAKVATPAPLKVALTAPTLSPIVIVPVPKEPATLPLAVPALIVNPVVSVLAAVVKLSAEVALF